MNTNANDANTCNSIASDTQQKKEAAASFKKLQPEEFYRHHIDKVLYTNLMVILKGALLGINPWVVFQSGSTLLTNFDCIEHMY